MLQTHLKDYNALKRRIDAVRAEAGDGELEPSKGALLKACGTYMDFLEALTGEPRAQIERLIDECATFLAGDAVLKEKLQSLARHAESGVATGEIRVHSYTFYVLVRALKPRRVLETGVANGKSSLMMLKAMQLNAAGELLSIDAATLESGGRDRHKAPGMEVGWLVPAELRDRWDLRFGFSTELLPRIATEQGGFDVFIHDSLSVYGNMTFEYGEARRLLQEEGLLVSDDIETCDAFEDFARAHAREVRCFGTLGVMRLARVGGAVR